MFRPSSKLKAAFPVAVLQQCAEHFIKLHDAPEKASWDECEKHFDMDFSHGLGMGVLGTGITIIGFFIAFLVINYNKKKEEQRIKEQNETKVHPYGDDTV